MNVPDQNEEFNILESSDIGFESTTMNNSLFDVALSRIPKTDGSQVIIATESGDRSQVGLGDDVRRVNRQSIVLNSAIPAIFSSRRAIWDGFMSIAVMLRGHKGASKALHPALQIDHHRPCR